MTKAVDYFSEDIIYTKGDVTPVILNIFKNAVAYTDLAIASEIKIDIRDKSGTLLRTLISTGGSPALVAISNVLTILTTAFTTVGKYKYDLQCTVGSYIETIGKGNWIIESEITL
jgi:hypothetical protein